MENNKQLEGMSVAILAEDGFEEAELKEPRKVLDAAGARTTLVSPQEKQVRAWKMKDWGGKIKVDARLSEARPEDFDALLLPGGVINADGLRMNADAVNFVRAFFANQKPVAAICHAPWMVIEAGYAKGRRMTSWPSLKTDLGNAGAQWLDDEVVVDGNMVTSRKPDDIPAFNREMLNLYGRTRHASQMTPQPMH
jgi:protease I